MVLIKRSSMMLFSSAHDPYSHAVRIVLAEKAVGVDILVVDDGESSLNNEDFLDINPEGNVPTLVDRDLILTEPGVIMEYLDERFPHPPLLPVYPVSRAKSRLTICRLRRDWYQWAEQLTEGTPQEAEEARKRMQLQLVHWEPIFADTECFLSDEFSLVDCYMIPMLWRLPTYGIQLTEKMVAIRRYCTNMFARTSFQASLTEYEVEIGEEHDIE